MRLILAHSPLLGPASWQGVATALRARGHAVEVPAWPRLSAIARDFYPALASGLAAGLDGAGDEPAVLAVHSGAGALVPALAGALRRPLLGVVFCDAILPHPGRSWFDTAPADLRRQLRAGAEEGRLPPWDRWWTPGALERLVPDPALREPLLAELEPLPLAYFEEPAPDAALGLPAAYLRLSGAYDDEAALAGRLGWPVVRLPLHHLAIVGQGESVATALEGLAEALARPAA